MLNWKSYLILIVPFILLVSALIYFVSAIDLPINPIITYTPTSETTCVNGKCTQTIYSEIIFADNKSKEGYNLEKTNESFFKLITSTRNGYDYQMYDDYTNHSVFFKNNSNNAEATRFEKDGYFFTYDLSGGQMRWAVKENQPSAIDTLGSGTPSNSQNTQVTINDNKANYSNAYYNTDVIYTANIDRVKEIFVLRGVPSFKDYYYLEYTGNIKFNASLDICANGQCYTPSGTQDDFETSGQIDFKHGNETIFFLSSPIIWDSNGSSTTGIYNVKGSNAQMEFKLRINKTWLEQAVFPIYIDPSIHLNSSKVVVDYYTSDTSSFSNYASLMRWDISSIPEGVIIINATLWLNETTTGVATGVDSDLNISRINNQTWDFSTNTTELSEQVDNIEDTFWFNLTGDPIVYTTDKGEYWGANVTTQFNASYDASETYLSLWFEDPDRPWNIYSTKVNDNTLRVGNGRFGFATFSSSSAQLNITYEGETNNPVVNLLTPANESVYTEGTNETFFINVTDDTEIDYVQWWSNFRNGTFISEQTNNTNIINSAIYNFTFNFSTWYGRINYTSLASLASTSNRQITMNGTDWWLVSQSGDFVFHLNSSFENQTDGFSTSTNTLPISLSNNGTELGIIDLGNDNFTRYTYNGVRIDNCSLRNAGGNLNYYAFDYNISDNTIWVLTDQTPSLVWHLDTLCNNLTGAFALDQRIISPSGMALINNTFYVISESTDLLYHYNMGTGIQIANYSAKNILNNGASIDVTGLTWNRTALSPIENLYTTSASPNVLSSFSRKTINSEPIIWNAYACDIYNNCAFNSTNYTYYFSSPEVITSTLDLDLIYPTSSINVNQYEFYNATLNVTCKNSDCGNASITIYTNISIASPLSSFDTNQTNSENIYQTGITTNGTYFWVGENEPSSSPLVYQYLMNGTATGVNWTLSGFGSQDLETNNTYIWSLDSSLDEVYVHDMDGTPVTHWDIAGSGNGNGLGITTNNTYIWIVDGADLKVYKYWMNGTYISNWDLDVTNNDAGGITTNNTYFWITEKNPISIFQYDMSGNLVDSYSIEEGVSESRAITHYDTSFWIVDFPSYHSVVEYSMAGDNPHWVKTPFFSGSHFYTNSSNPNITNSLNVGESHLQNFWINATDNAGTYQFYATVNLTSNESISNYTNVWEVTIVVIDTCTYSSGNWVIDCSDNCVLGGSVDLGGNNVSIIGSGTFKTNGYNISNFQNSIIKGTDSSNLCIVTCNLGGCLKSGFV